MKEDFELTLFDRIEVIKTADRTYDLQKNAYIPLSGGRDSLVLSHLIDKAIPGNRIPRVFDNTGLEFQITVNFVKELQTQDDRIQIIVPGIRVNEMLKKYGYPFKSKQHSQNLAIYQNSGVNLSVKRYLGIIESTTKFRCPKCLEYQFKDKFELKCSDKCCLKMKKEPMHKWAVENNKPITILGLKQGEGGQRASHKGCVVYDKEKNMIKFKPMNPISEKFENWYIEKEHIKLSLLYYPPYNLLRTGCVGCPFNIHLQEELDMLKEFLPIEYKRAEYIWKPVYEEYRSKHYRLKEYTQMKLF